MSRHPFVMRRVLAGCRRPCWGHTVLPDDVGVVGNGVALCFGAVEKWICSWDLYTELPTLRSLPATS